MIISDEQVRLALEYLHTDSKMCDAHILAGAREVSAEFVERVRAEISGCPEMRADRIAEAQELLTGHEPSSHEVAEKMLGRIASDQLR
jgi:hypothetical protein